MGALEVRLLGILPVTRARGADVSAGGAMRYLAELPWVPQAIAANRELAWRELDGRVVEVGTQEVRWELPDGPFAYWRGTITSLELDPSD